MREGIDIIIPVHNEGEKTRQCLESIIAATRIPYRLIIIDNGSSDNEKSQYAPVLQRAAAYHLMENTSNTGFVQATNQGVVWHLANNPAPYVVLQNNDTVIFGDVYARLIRHIERRSNVGAVGPTTSECDSWQSVLHLEAMPRFRRRLARMNLPDLSHELRDQVLKQTFAGQSYEAGMIAFFCVLMSRETIARVGLLSHEYGVGLRDDDDYCERIKQAGLTIRLACDAYVFHHHRTTFRKLFTPDQIEAIKDKNMAIFRQKFPQG